MASYEGDVDSGLLQHSEIRFWDAAVGNDLVQGGGRGDEREAAASELARVANHYSALGDIEHDPVDFRFEQVGRTQAEVNVEAIDAQKK